MAHIAFGGALSHSPLLNYPVSGDDAQIAAFKTAVDEMGRRLRQAEPHILVIFGPDHFRTLFYDLMPAYTIGIEQVEGWGDWNTPVGPFPVYPQFATHILEFLMEEGFDPVFSREIKVDHGITQPLQLMSLADLPIIPIIINAAGPPLPAPVRCHQFGAAVGRAIAAFPADLHVAIIASGGLSHDPPGPSIENAVHGRTNGFASSRDREMKLLKNVDKLQARINSEWDRNVLDHFVRGDVGTLAEMLTTESIFEMAGNGGQEIRTWIAAAGALGNPKMELLCYEPISALITGMGVITT